MDDRRRDARGPGAGDEEALRRLLEEAGPRPALPEDDLEEITAAARTAWRERHGERETERAGRRSVRILSGLAAVLVVGLGLALVLARWGERDPAEPGATVARIEAVSGPGELIAGGGAPVPLEADAALPAGSVLVTGGAAGSGPGRAALLLASGAVARLDSDTRVRLVSPSVIALEAGAVYLDTGELREGGRGVRVAVRTPMGIARDVGTRFAVRLGASGTPEALLVRVREGAVVVERQGMSYRAAGGEELVVRGDGSVERREVPRYGAGWEWVLEAAPAFEAEGRSLRELLDWVSRETGWEVHFEEPALADAAAGIVLHGSLAGVGPQEAPFVVLPGAGLEGELMGDVLVVRRPG